MLPTTDVIVIISISLFPIIISLLISLMTTKIVKECKFKSQIINISLYFVSLIIFIAGHYLYFLNPLMLFDLMGFFE
jgi:hypothetical protein